jgi:hypothetical protein
MIRILTLGIVCLTGIGGVTAVKNLPSRTPAAEVVVGDVVYPVAVNTKADRLPVPVETSPVVNKSEPEAPTADLASKQPDVANTQPPQEQSPPQIEDKPSIRKSISPPQRDRSAKRFRARRHAVSSRSQARAPASGQIEAARTCSSGGLDSVLRKLDLKPAC